jgi:hypothetical protein
MSQEKPDNKLREEGRPDQEALLDAGITVVTTLNFQHFELSRAHWRGVCVVVVTQRTVHSLSKCRYYDTRSDSADLRYHQ